MKPIALHDKTGTILAAAQLTEGYSGPVPVARKGTKVVTLEVPDAHARLDFAAVCNQLRVDTARARWWRARSRNPLTDTAHPLVRVVLGRMAMVRLVLLAGVTLASACGSRAPDPSVVAAREREIREAMEHYMVAARAVDPDGIAACFTATGTLFEPGIQPVETRDAIRAFVASFSGVRVDVATATPEAIEVFGDTAMLWGTYFEKLAFPGQPVSEQHGRFVIQWLRQPDGAWLIHRYFRVPAPPS